MQEWQYLSQGILSHPTMAADEIGLKSLISVMKNISKENVANKNASIAWAVLTRKEPYIGLSLNVGIRLLTSRLDKREAKSV